jgi:hypothetical protein
LAEIASAQSGAAAISGKVLDAATNKSVPFAIVTVVRIGLPPFTRTTKSGADGTFQVQSLPAGAFSICVQAPGDRYLDPCQWSGSPRAVSLAAGQSVPGVTVSLAAASVLQVQVQDPQNAFSQKTRDGRRPELTLGVWGPKGLFYPAHGASGSTSAPASAGVVHTYRLPIPRDTALKFHISSRDLKLADGAGIALPANASQQAFQHATGDANPRSFAFTVLGLLP